MKKILMMTAVGALAFTGFQAHADQVANRVAPVPAPAPAEAEAGLVEIAPVKKEFYEIIIKDHKFSPEEITVPAGEKIKLIIDNQDPTPEEFESHDMNREKIIRGNKKATIYVGPLEPGKYHFFGEFNMDTANGYIIAK